eukprot:scaffold1272_cov250-Pinguiococcus_pyrenoidosus.AAC.20
MALESRESTYRSVVVAGGLHEGLRLAHEGANLHGNLRWQRRRVAGHLERLRPHVVRGAHDAVRARRWAEWGVG